MFKLHRYRLTDKNIAAQKIIKGKKTKKKRRKEINKEISLIIGINKIYVLSDLIILEG